MPTKIYIVVGNHYDGDGDWSPSNLKAFFDRVAAEKHAQELDAATKVKIALAQEFRDYAYRWDKANRPHQARDVTRLPREERAKAVEELREWGQKLLAEQYRYLQEDRGLTKEEADEIWLWGASQEIEYSVEEMEVE
jgi:hypothetical protein